MSAAGGPTPTSTMMEDHKGNRQQMVSRDDLLKAIQKMQLPQVQWNSPSSGLPQVTGGNG